MRSVYAICLVMKGECMAREMIELEFFERSRKYYYADGSHIEFKNVTHFLNSTTTHRLRADGVLVIVERGWRSITIDSDEFTC